MSSKSTARKTVLIIFSFLLSLFIFFLSFFSVVRATVFDESYVKSMIEKSGYYENLKKEIDEYFISYGHASGFDETFMTSLDSVSRIREDTGVSLDYLYGKIDTNFNKQKFAAYVVSEMQKNAEARNYTLNSEVDSAIQYSANLCAQLYESSINIIFADNVRPLIKAFNLPILAAIIAMAVMSIISVMIIFLTSKHKHRALRYIIYSLSASAFLLLILSLVPLLSGKIQLLNFVSNAMHLLSNVYLTNFFLCFLYVAVVVIALIVVVSIFYVRKKKSVIVRVKKHSSRV